jgi:signal peptidase I
MFVGLGRVSGDSMLPNYHDGDIVLIQRRFFEVNNGDVLVIRDTVKQKVLVKRVIAKAGDHFNMTRNGKIILNGEELTEDYIYARFWQSPISVNQVIPDGAYFVMGDNRNNSYDSRNELSFVGDYQILGKVVLNISKLTGNKLHGMEHVEEP